MLICFAVYYLKFTQKCKNHPQLDGNGCITLLAFSGQGINPHGAVKAKKGPKNFQMGEQEMEQNSYAISYQLTSQHHDVNTITWEFDAETV